ERKKGEESLRASEERFRKAITLAPYPIMIHSEGKVLQLSKEWSNQTGYTIDDIPTIKEWTLKAYGKDAVPSQEFIENLYKIDKTQYDGEWKVKVKDGSYRIWDFSSSPIGESENGNRMAMSMASDITERNQKQEALKQKTKELQEYYDLMIGRELKMVELKKEVNELMRKLGNTDKYEI
ncbi:MAG: PAS domain-containing protein, partial [Candidatus Delongbacteria bacterium]|nr:PAS domain-containing protein [Candidatus Delongbacteria bacterium]